MSNSFNLIIPELSPRFLCDSLRFPAFRRQSLTIMKTAGKTNFGYKMGEKSNRPEIKQWTLNRHLTNKMRIFWYKTHDSPKSTTNKMNKVFQYQIVNTPKTHTRHKTIKLTRYDYMHISYICALSRPSFDIQETPPSICLYICLNKSLRF